MPFEFLSFSYDLMKMFSRHSIEEYNSWVKEEARKVTERSSLAHHNVVKFNIKSFLTVISSVAIKQQMPKQVAH